MSVIAELKRRNVVRVTMRRLADDPRYKALLKKLKLPERGYPA